MTREELQAVHDEAERRLPDHPEYREVTAVQGDYFNLIVDATGLPRPIKSRQDLDTYMPKR